MAQRQQDEAQQLRREELASEQRRRDEAYQLRREELAREEKRRDEERELRREELAREDSRRRDEMLIGLIQTFKQPTNDTRGRSRTRRGCEREESRSRVLMPESHNDYGTLQTAGNLSIDAHGVYMAQSKPRYKKLRDTYNMSDAEFTAHFTKDINTGQGVFIPSNNPEEIINICHIENAVLPYMFVYATAVLDTSYLKLRELYMLRPLAEPEIWHLTDIWHSQLMEAVEAGEDVSRYTPEYMVRQQLSGQLQRGGATPPSGAQHLMSSRRLDQSERTGGNIGQPQPVDEIQPSAVTLREVILDSRLPYGSRTISVGLANMVKANPEVIAEMPIIKSRPNDQKVNISMFASDPSMVKYAPFFKSMAETTYVTALIQVMTFSVIGEINSETAKQAVSAALFSHRSASPNPSLICVSAVYTKYSSTDERRPESQDFKLALIPYNPDNSAESFFLLNNIGKPALALSTAIADAGSDPESDTSDFALSNELIITLITAVRGGGSNNKIGTIMSAIQNAIIQRNIDYATSSSNGNFEHGERNLTPEERAALQEGEKNKIVEKRTGKELSYELKDPVIGTIVNHVFKHNNFCFLSVLKKSIEKTVAAAHVRKLMGVGGITEKNLKTAFKNATGYDCSNMIRLDAATEFSYRIGLIVYIVDIDGSVINMPYLKETLQKNNSADDGDYSSPRYIEKLSEKVACMQFRFVLFFNNHYSQIRRHKLVRPSVNDIIRGKSAEDKDNVLLPPQVSNIPNMVYTAFVYFDLETVYSNPDIECGNLIRPYSISIGIKSTGYTLNNLSNGKIVKRVRDIMSKHSVAEIKPRKPIDYTKSGSRSAFDAETHTYITSTPNRTEIFSHMESVVANHRNNVISKFTADDLTNINFNYVFMAYNGSNFDFVPFLVSMVNRQDVKKHENSIIRSTGKLANFRFISKYNKFPLRPTKDSEPVVRPLYKYTYSIWDLHNYLPGGLGITAKNYGLSISKLTLDHAEMQAAYIKQNYDADDVAADITDAITYDGEYFKDYLKNHEKELTDYNNADVDVLAALTEAAAEGFNRLGEDVAFVNKSNGIRDVTSYPTLPRFASYLLQSVIGAVYGGEMVDKIMKLGEALTVSSGKPLSKFNSYARFNKMWETYWNPLLHSIEYNKLSNFKFSYRFDDMTVISPEMASFQTYVDFLRKEGWPPKYANDNYAKAEETVNIVTNLKEHTSTDIVEWKRAIKHFPMQTDFFIRQSLIAGRTSGSHARIGGLSSSELLSQSYVAGVNLYSKPHHFLDVTSLYPAMMANYPYPRGGTKTVSLKEFEKDYIPKLMKCSDIMSYTRDGGKLFLVYATVNQLPDGWLENHNFMLPERLEDGKLNWSTPNSSNSWAGTYLLPTSTYIDALQAGYVVKPVILPDSAFSVDDDLIEDDRCGWFWHRHCYPFTRFVRTLFNKKQEQDDLRNSKSPNYNPSLREAVKLTLNSVSGKIIQKQHDKETILVSSKDELIDALKDIDGNYDAGDFKQFYGTDAMWVTKPGNEKKLSTAPTYLGIMVYAYSRSYMWNLFFKDGHVRYSDTDSALVDTAHYECLKDEGMVTRGLGMLDSEGEFDRVIVIAPKMYYLLNSKTLSYKARAKGISKRSTYTGYPAAVYEEWWNNFAIADELKDADGNINSNVNIQKLAAEWWISRTANVVTHECTFGDEPMGFYIICYCTGVVVTSDISIKKDLLKSKWTQGVIRKKTTWPSFCCAETVETVETVEAAEAAEAV